MALLLYRRLKGKGNKTNTCPHQLQTPAEAPEGSAAIGKPEPGYLVQEPGTETANTNVQTQSHALHAGGIDPKGRCQVCREEKLAARSYRVKLIVGLFFPFALQALDVTIIASALPWIASDFSAPKCSQFCSSY